MNILLRFWFWSFIGSSFIERFNLSPFGFILPCWTMIFSVYSCTARCYDSNEPKIIENGVRMQKICPFSYCSFCCFSVGRKFRSGGRKFRPPEVPAVAPEVPALFFHLSSLDKSFWCFSLEGVRIFAPEVSSGNFRTTGSSGPRPEVPVHNPGISGPSLLPTVRFWRRL